jgi:hypothetical protein
MKITGIIDINFAKKVFRLGSSNLEKVQLALPGPNPIKPLRHNLGHIDVNSAINSLITLCPMISKMKLDIDVNYTMLFEA